MDRVRIITSGVALLIGIVLMYVFLPPQPPLSSPTKSTNSPPPQENIVSGALCMGTEITVDYEMKNGMKSPFECQPFCATRQSAYHYILYKNGFGTQCGIASCQDWGEDYCIFCKVPDAVLSKYYLTPSSNKPACQPLKKNSNLTPPIR